jgi:carbon storage regulator
MVSPLPVVKVLIMEVGDLMLVLTRKLNEKIRIGDNIVLTVVEVKGNRVRLGIEAPTDIAIVRAELLPESPPTPPKGKRDTTRKTRKKAG